MLPLAGRMRTLCNLRLQCLPHDRKSDFCLVYLSHRILMLNWQGRFGAVSRRGICLIWFRGRHIPPSMPYREARSVAESSEGPTASKSDRTGRNPGMTRLVRRSSAGSGGTAFFCLVQTLRQRMRKCSGSPIPSLQTKLTCCMVFTWNWHFNWFYSHQRSVRTVRVWKMASCRLGRLKCSLVNIALHEWSRLSGLSVDEFQDLPIQFWQVLKAKNFNRCGILLVGLGGPNTYEKNYEMRIGSLPLSWNGRITQNFFGAWRRQLKKHKTTGLHQMAEARPEEKVARRRCLSRH